MADDDNDCPYWFEMHDVRLSVLCCTLMDSCWPVGQISQIGYLVPGKKLEQSKSPNTFFVVVAVL